LSLDPTDLALVEALQADARASNKELAAAVHLAPSTTHARVRRLFDTGAIRGTHAEVAPEVLGIGLSALIFVRLGTHARDAVRSFWELALTHPEVTAAWYVGGDDDIVLSVAVRDTSHLRDLVLDRVPAWGDVGRVRTELVFDHVRKRPPMYNR